MSEEEILLGRLRGMFARFQGIAGVDPTAPRGSMTWTQAFRAIAANLSALGIRTASVDWPAVTRACGPRFADRSVLVLELRRLANVIEYATTQRIRIAP